MQLEINTPLDTAKIAALITNQADLFVVTPNAAWSFEHAAMACYLHCGFHEISRYGTRVVMAKDLAAATRESLR